MLRRNIFQAEETAGNVKKSGAGRTVTLLEQYGEPDPGRPKLRASVRQLYGAK
jgi:hypothetical protein